jgi:SNF2-related domain
LFNLIPTLHNVPTIGPGKTCEIIGLIVASLSELKRERDDYNNNGIHHRRKMIHSTLIVVPPSLVSQWENEIIKCTGHTLIVDVIDGKTGAISRRNDSNFDSDADIVLTTYKGLVQRQVAPILQTKRWGRIVLDEMQEIRTSTSVIAKSCEELEGDRRWMLSGTPIFDGIDDLLGELNFLRLEPFSAASEDGFFDFMIKDPWINRHLTAIDTLKVLGTIMLRRSKSMTIKATGTAILDLKPLSVEYVPIQQTKSERAIYYFLESIHARVVRSAKSMQSTNVTKTISEVEKSKASRKLCFRLVREACNSVVLLNGGVGATSQLKILNNLLITDARKAAQNNVDNTNETNQPQVISCDEAIVHLAQVQHATRTYNGKEGVALLSLGFGRGLSKRSHATDSVDAKLSQSIEILKKAKLDYAMAVSQQAKARWLLALECITMGQLREEYTNVALKFRTLWTWRSIPDWRSHHMMRGWRPSLPLLSNWHETHPEFYWSHPNALTMQRIPKYISLVELTNCLGNVLLEERMYKNLEAATSGIRVIILMNDDKKSEWYAGLQFQTKDDLNVILHKTSTSYGIVVTNTAENQQMRDVVACCKALYEESHANYLIHPTEMNHGYQKMAFKELKLAKHGLRIVHANKFHDDILGTIRLSQACGAYRSCMPSTFREMYQSSQRMIAECRETIYSSRDIIRREEPTINQLQKIKKKELTGIDEPIPAMSTFEKLNALACGKQKETQCCICLDYLGSNDDDDPANLNTATVSMIDCGHLYCRKCLESCRRVCPTCRRQFKYETDVSYIDITKSSNRDETLTTISEVKNQVLLDAYRMLEGGEGTLEPIMWDRLYHAIGVPNASYLDARVSALPRHFIGHLRECIKGLPLMCHHTSFPNMLDVEELWMSTKVKTLLQDIPRDERSVVFSSSNATIKVNFLYVICFLFVSVVNKVTDVFFCLIQILAFANGI